MLCVHSTGVSRTFCTSSSEEARVLIVVFTVRQKERAASVVFADIPMYFAWTESCGREFFFVVAGFGGFDGDDVMCMRNILLSISDCPM